MFNNSTPSLADIAAVTGNDRGGFGNGNGWWVLIILLAIFGGWGNSTRNGNGIQDNYVLATDFANLERKLDGVNNGLCDGFYAQNTNTLNAAAGIQNTLAQGFNGVNTAIVTQGYETRLGTQSLGSQLSSCCCDLKENIQANTTQGVMNTAALQNQIQQASNASERTAAQARFDAQQYNCTTLQAIDKVGDRIIDYLASEKTQALRDENFTLKLAASQQAQNNVLINQLRPAPIPAYGVPNPYAYSGYGGCCSGTNSYY